MATCPKCHEELKEEKGVRSCPNGCEIYTASPQGSTFHNNTGTIKGSDGHWYQTGTEGSYRKLPTNNGD